MDPQLLQQIMQLLQQYQAPGGTGFKGFGAMAPQTPPGASQGAPSATQLPAMSQAPPNAQQPAQAQQAFAPNLAQQAKQQFNPQRLLATPAPGGLQGI